MKFLRIPPVLIVVGLAFVSALSACDDDAALFDTEPSEEPGGEGGGEPAGDGDFGGGDHDGRLSLGGSVGDREPVLRSEPDACSEPLIYDRSGCSDAFTGGVTFCFTPEELVDVCSPVQLRAALENLGGAGGATQLEPPAMCPDYEDLSFNFVGRACGGQHHAPVCSVPVYEDAGRCCYQIATAVNAC